MQACAKTNRVSRSMLSTLRVAASGAPMKLQHSSLKVEGSKLIVLKVDK